MADISFPAAKHRKPALPMSPPGFYEGTFEIRTRLSLPPNTPAGPRPVSLLLTLQPCNESTCNDTVEIRLDFSLPITR